MIRTAVAAFVAFAFATPAAADWRQGPSGISLPDQVGAMRRGEERVVVADRSDVIVQYGTATEPVTLFVLRASHPNPALWFERVYAAMENSVGPLGPGQPTPFTLGGGDKPNGLRAAYPLTRAPWKATAVAVAQHGEWLIKLRVTSKTLDAAGVAARRDQLLAALRFADRPTRAPLPLVVPNLCAAPATFAGRPRPGEELRMAAAVVGIVAMSASRGFGLAAEPAKWCKQPLDGQFGRAASLYRSLDGKSWTLLLGDAGTVASGVRPVGIGPGHGGGRSDAHRAGDAGRHV